MTNFQRHSGEATILPYKKTASTAFEAGDPVVQTSGLLTVANASATPATVLGITQRTVVSTDDDYADAVDVMVEVPDEGTVYKAKVGSGSPAQTMVGQRYDLDANGEVNLTAQTKNVVEVVRLAQESDYIYVTFVNN